MIVEDKKSGAVGAMNEDQFPVGMRVLAVDDDPICLKVLETLLRKCQYHVTITNQAVKALQMLRDNRSSYDLVISDVNMPDIDGFKLLELVGLEMDLPVIMLSAHSDTKLVMKGISHGACDYLLKPVRYEELKNIWQHVIRRKKVDSKDQIISVDQDKVGPVNGEIGQGVTSGNTDQNGKTNRKRKDQNEDEEEDGEENGHDSDDPGTQKKPRVVWTVELHRKFVAAVNQLGFEKAVPKKILDLMNIDGLTRENVASHLQKFRLYLKKQANMLAACGSKDSSYLRMGSLDGFNDFRSLAGPGSFSRASLSSYPPGRILGRLNSPSTLTLRGITSSGMIQPGASQNLSSSVNSLAKLQSVSYTVNKNTSLFQGVPTSFELNQLQQSNGINPTSDFSPTENSNIFTAISLPDGRARLGSSSNNMNDVPNNSSLLQRNPQQAQSCILQSNESSLLMASSNTESFGIGTSGFSSFLDQGRCHDKWKNAAQFPSNPLHNCGENASSSNPQVLGTPIDFPSSSARSQAAVCSRDTQTQAGLIGNFVPDMSYTPGQRWEEPTQHYSHTLSHNYNTIDTLSSVDVSDPFRHSMSQANAIGIENIGMSINGQINNGASAPRQGGTDKSIDKVATDVSYMLDQTKSQGGFIQNSYNCLDDLMNTMAKRVAVTQEQNYAMPMDGEMGYDAYSSLGSCM